MRIHHIALRTRRLAQLVRFYRTVFGLRRLRSSRAGGRTRSVWLEAGRSILMIERAEPSEPAVPRASRELVAFAVGRAEHRRLLERLARLEVKLDGDPTAFTTYFRDPDGRRIAASHFVADFDVRGRGARRRVRRPGRRGDRTGRA